MAGSRVTTWLVLAALSVAFAAGLLFLHTPAALLLGPLFAAALVAARGGKASLPAPAVLLAQGVVGCLIAKMVPFSALVEFAEHWVPFAVGVAGVIASGVLVGWVAARVEVLPGTSALWGVSPGASSVMTFMAEEYGADMRLVAFMQYFRSVLVVVTAALVARLFGGSTAEAPHVVVWLPPPAWGPLAATLALAVGGALAGKWLRVPAGGFLVPMVAGVALAHFGLIVFELPPWLLAAAYAALGWSIGLRFTRDVLGHVVRALPAVLASVAALMLLCAGVAAFLVATTDHGPLTAYLATTPGGTSSVAAIAASTDVNQAFVMAMQTVRTLAVLVLAPIVTRFVAARFDAARRGRGGVT
jgi:uncharacterized protein